MPGKRFTGPIIEAMAPGPNGPYRVIARADAARAKGWEIVTVTTEPNIGLPPEYTKPTTGFWPELLGGER